ncbi:hypothetical protein AMTR_s00068p00205470 [Amborella trichopoda]|uniref:Uncharacterized protein n=1 Tax=Amborella trichopoda TaxID=13333 RepID=U5DDE8_AMBTC|nr:hypothetical protein AMTR_s00068p00205470 [Amborella trichopoda]
MNRRCGADRAGSRGIDLIATVDEDYGRENQFPPLFFNKIFFQNLKLFSPNINYSTSENVTPDSTGPPRQQNDITDPRKPRCRFPRRDVGPEFGEGAMNLAARSRQARIRRVIQSGHVIIDRALLTAHTWAHRPLTVPFVRLPFRVTS